jgi:hypothetical protein
MEKAQQKETDEAAKGCLQLLVSGGQSIDEVRTAGEKPKVRPFSHLWPLPFPSF